MGQSSASRVSSDVENKASGAEAAPFVSSSLLLRTWCLTGATQRRVGEGGQRRNGQCPAGREQHRAAQLAARTPQSPRTDDRQAILGHHAQPPLPVLYPPACFLCLDFFPLIYPYSGHPSQTGPLCPFRFRPRTIKDAPHNYLLLPPARLCSLQASRAPWRSPCDASFHPFVP